MSADENPHTHSVFGDEGRKRPEPAPVEVVDAVKGVPAAAPKNRWDALGFDADTLTRGKIRGKLQARLDSCVKEAVGAGATEDSIAVMIGEAYRSIDAKVSEGLSRLYVNYKGAITQEATPGVFGDHELHLSTKMCRDILTCHLALKGFRCDYNDGWFYVELPRNVS